MPILPLINFRESDSTRDIKDSAKKKKAAIFSHTSARKPTEKMALVLPGHGSYNHASFDGAAPIRNKPMKHKAVAIIPARYASTRLPGKPLIEIAGKPMILGVVERARQSASISRVIVATDDERGFQAVTGAGVEATMTSPDHATGTDRLAEVAENLDAEIIVNVQGDEPLIEPSTIEAAVAPLLA